MTQKTITIALDAALYEWVKEGAALSGLSVESFVSGLVKDEHARRALDSMAAWVREDDCGPSTEEIDAVRARMLGDEET